MVPSHPLGRKLAVKAAALACGVLACTAARPVPAQSAVIENKDGISYALTIDEKGERSTHQIGPGAKIESVCLKGCVLILDGVRDGAYQLPEGNEIVSIEEGVLFYDGAVAPKAD